MMRWSMVCFSSMLLMSPATAQDLGGMNPAEVGQGMVMPSAIAAQAKHDAARAGQRNGRAAPTAAQKRACGNLNGFRRRYGADDAKVRQLARLCRDAGM